MKNKLVLIYPNCGNLYVLCTDRFLRGGILIMLIKVMTLHQVTGSTVDQRFSNAICFVMQVNV